jgi:hypothetical protein
MRFARIRCMGAIAIHGSRISACAHRDWEDGPRGDRISREQAAVSQRGALREASGRLSTPMTPMLISSDR